MKKKKIMKKKILLINLTKWKLIINLRQLKKKKISYAGQSEIYGELSNSSGKGFIPEQK